MLGPWELPICHTECMGTRLAVSPMLALILLTGSPPRVRAQRPAPPPPLFSPWYGEALRDILTLEEADAARLERRLVANPDDLPARLKLMAYHQRADRAGRPEDRAERVRHALWLIEHHPESEILHSFAARFTPGEMTLADERRAAVLWGAAAQAKPHDAAIQWNAATFFEALDPALHLRYLEATAAADPNHPFALRVLAFLYALSILERGPLAARAEAGLEASKNVWVLSNAAYMFQSQYNMAVQRGAPNPRARELAERYFLRARALDPNLDRQAILPQLDPAAMARARQVESQAARDVQARAAEAVGHIRRLPVEAFPELPPAIAGVLLTRGCRVPQPSPEGAPRNVIRGEFFVRGEAGWAVLCSVNQSTTMLVFRNGSDTRPDALFTSEDRSYVQEVDRGRFGYSREIRAVGRDFMMGNYRAYGGPEPPPIDHQGIDDAFLEKASVTWYLYRGNWQRLQGAD